MKKFLQRIAAAIRREPEFERSDHTPLAIDEPPGQVDRELDAGYDPEPPERRD